MLPEIRVIYDKKLHYAALFILCVLAFFVYNHTIYVNQMEARNFITAREILEKGNWLTLTMNGELRLAKPPLPTWITAVSAKYFGLDNISTLRFPAGFMATLLIFIMYAFSYKCTKDRLTAFFGSLVLVSSFYIVYVGRANTWDIYCHSFMLGAIYLLYDAWGSKKVAWFKFIIAGILLGLSFLSKGPVSFYVLFLPFLSAYVIINGSMSILKKWPQLLLALGLFSVIAFWWPVYIWLLHADAARAVANLEANSWIERHTKPFWYYWYFPAVSGIWTLFIVTSLNFAYAKANFKMFKEYRFAFLWMIGSVFLLSVVPEKKDTYLMPVLIPAALLTAQFIYHLYSVFKQRTAKRIDLFLYYLNSIPIAIVVFVMPFVLYFFAYSRSHMHINLFIALCFIYFFIFVYLLSSIYTKNVIGLIFSIVIIMGVAEAGILPFASRLINRNPNYKDFSGVEKNDEANRLNYFHPYSENFRMELVWAAGKEVRAWNFNKESAVPVKGIAVFSDNKLSESLPADALKRYDIKLIDYYNQSRKKPKGGKPKKFFKYLSIVKNKNSVPK